MTQLKQQRKIIESSTSFAIKAMLLSVYDQKIAALEKEFADM